MSKIRIFVTRKKEQMTIGFLQHAGLLHIDHDQNTQVKPNIQEESSRVEYQLARAEHLFDFLIHAFNEKKQQTIKKTKITINEKESYLKTINFNWDTVDAAHSLEESTVELQNEAKALKKERELLKSFTQLETPLSKVTATKTTNIITGKISKITIKEFFASLPSRQVHVKKLSEKQDDAYFYIIFRKEISSEIDQIIRTFEVKTVDLPKRRGTASEEIDRITRRLKKIKQFLSANHEKHLQIAKEYIHDTRIIIDELHDKKERRKSWNYLDQNLLLTSITGWIPTLEIPKFQKGLDKITEHASYIETLKTDEEPPILLKNNKLFRPFQVVTEMYGLPKFNEVDPTGYLSIWFVVFFGFAITDAGYGIIMMLLFGGALALKKVNEEMKPMIQLLTIGGFFTFIMGTLFGGWFGLDLTTLSFSNPIGTAWLDFARSMIIFEPLKDPVSILIFALLLGILHIIWGLFALGMSEWQQGRRLGGILDAGPWIITIITFLLWIGATTKFSIFTNLDTEILKNTIYIGLISVFIFGARKGKSIPGKLLNGIGGLYAAVGYFSDVLSYSRLLALGLATGIVAMAMNLIAGLLFDVPFVGWILGIAMLIAGHTFNLALNALGAFIHSARLQFVEFFKLFMQGGGKVYNPLRKLRVHTNLIAEEWQSVITDKK